MFATGVKDVLPDIAGYQECWGISVVHCPYCHGHEFAGKAAAIYADGEAAKQLANLLLPIHPNLALISNSIDGCDFGDKVSLIEQNIKTIHHQNGKLNAITFDDGEKLEIDVLYTDPNFEQHSSIAETIGCELTDKNLIYINAEQQTSIPGIYACGDCTSAMRSIATAVASGNLAGAIINKTLSEMYLMATM